MTNQRRITILVASVIVIAAIVVITLHPWTKQAPVKQYRAGETITYTDATTGDRESDLPGESGNQTSEVILPPDATINGLDSLKTYMSDAQYLSVSNTLTSFLLAHSGSSVVSAGVKQQTITQSNNTLNFTLIADRPQLNYLVTIDLSDSQNPGVTMQEVQ